MAGLKILLAGVGGQGIVTMGKMIANACDKDGIKVLVSETHGLSQRGGAVDVHVKIGDFYSPLIAAGDADVVVALEANEAVRNREYASKNTVFVINTEIVKPDVPDVMPKTLDEIKDIMKDTKYVTVDGKKIAEETGNPIGVNAAIIGFMSGYGILDIVKEKSLYDSMISDKNRKTFEMGKHEANQIIKNRTVR